jgi:hypothetical protein
MNSTEFVKHTIDKLVIEFPEIQCSYQYKVSSNTHFVEILPSSVYKFDEKYAKAETKATLEFIAMFPDEGICFISDDAIVVIDKPDFVKSGSAYYLPQTIVFASKEELPVVNWLPPINWGTHLDVGVSPDYTFNNAEGWLPTTNWLPPINFGTHLDVGVSPDLTCVNMEEWLPTINWNIPLNLGVSQNQSLYDLITSIESYPLDSPTVKGSSMVISEDFENEIPLAA